MIQRKAIQCHDHLERVCITSSYHGFSNVSAHLLRQWVVWPNL